MNRGEQEPIYLDIYNTRWSQKHIHNHWK